MEEEGWRGIALLAFGFWLGHGNVGIIVNVPSSGACCWQHDRSGPQRVKSVLCYAKTCEDQPAFNSPLVLIHRLCELSGRLGPLPAAVKMVVCGVGLSASGTSLWREVAIPTRNSALFVRALAKIGKPAKANTRADEDLNLCNIRILPLLSARPAEVHRYLSLFHQGP